MFLSLDWVIKKRSYFRLTCRQCCKSISYHNLQVKNKEKDFSSCYVSDTFLFYFQAIFLTVFSVVALYIPNSSSRRSSSNNTFNSSSSYTFCFTVPSFSLTSDSPFLNLKLEDVGKSRYRFIIKYYCNILIINVNSTKLYSK